MADSMINKIPLGIIVFNHSLNIISINISSKTIIEKVGDSFLDMTKIIVKKTIDRNESIERIVKYIKMDELHVWKIKTEIINSPSQIMAIIQDITLICQLEATVLKAEKLAIIGQLALGSLLEIRNPLTSAIGFCRFIQQHNAVNSEYIKIIADELAQIQNIVESTPSINDTSRPTNLEMVYKNIWIYLSSKVKSYNLIMISDGFENLAVNVAEEYVNTVIGNLFSILNINTEEDINVIICVELHEDARHLNLSIKANFALVPGLNGELQDAISNLEGRNTQIELRLIDDRTIVLSSHLPIIIPHSKSPLKDVDPFLVPEGLERGSSN